MVSGTINFYTNGTTVRISSATAILPFQWNYISMTRSSNVISAHVNGASLGTYSQSGTFGSATKKLQIGNATNNVNGYISGVILVDGSANTSVPTAPPTAISGTNLLLNFTNAGIFDNTGKNVLETVGNAQVDTSVKKFGLGSMKFDGTGDYLLVPHSVDQLFGTGPFTIEMWVNPDTIGLKAFIGKGASGSTGWAVGIDSSGRVVFYYGSTSFTSTGSISALTWTHIAVVREGTGTNQTKIYINAVNDGTGTVSTDFTQTEAMNIGSGRGGSGLLNGYIDDLRLTKGVARTITLPTAAFPNQ
jgi:hypothetical protein